MRSDQHPLRAVIACGGTGGHLFPGLAVAEVLHAKGHEVLLFVSEKEIDSTALNAHPQFRAEKLPSVGMPRNPLSPAFIGFLRRCLESQRHSLWVFKKFRPHVVLGMGGFTSTPPIIAARLRGIPSFIHESNAIPGRANKLAARFASRVLLGFEDCRAAFPGAECIVTGTPVRKNLGQPLERTAALRAFNLEAERQTLLVTGGSQGATGINQLLFKSVPLMNRSRLQIIHLTGKNDDRLASANYQREEIPHFVAPFHHHMEEAYSAADLVVSRSGASSLSEVSRFGLPSVLIPYPFATDDHQSANAAIFTRVGAAESLGERETTPESFAKLVDSLLEDSSRRQTMSEAARRLDPGTAAENVAEVMERAAREGLK